ncbi:hypothetical protein CM240_0074 [Clostridium bornimense]|uniref:Uncharacterized protein n=1 Tax=Clostridium bornimense TaxID=1216932 RepID=W6RSM9_9CLOT|nr:ankyrin repeat domain-containing protein [Clostridium bornimense]CDM67253.1 hypothetical protein CM240_0074 [Clostridium bornimense]
MKINKKVMSMILIVIVVLGYFIIRDKIFVSNNTKLYSGIENNNFSLIDEALVEGCDINEFDHINNGESKPIFIAMNNNNENNREVVKYLIKNGADVNSCREDGTSILMAMASENNNEICQLLLDYGANIEYRDKNGYTALEYAASGSEDENRIMSTIELFLDNGGKIGPNTLEAVFKGRSIYNDGDGKYALVNFVLKSLLDNNYESELKPVVEAAILGETNKVTSLICKNDINEDDRDTILFYTAAFGDVDTIKVLQEKGAELEVCNNYGMSILTIAAKYGNIDVVRYLLDQGLDVNGGEGYVPPVVMAAKNNHYDVVKYLIEKGANLVPSSDFYNVLYEAASNGNVQMVDLILKSGYPLDDNYLFSTATKVIKNRNTSIVQYLLDNGYDLKIKKDGQSLLEYADDYYVAKVLVEGGLDINEYNKSAKDLKMLEYLFENGASPNRILENAIAYGNMDILKLAIRYDANINYIDEDSHMKNSPLTLAAYSGSKDIMKKIIKNGGDINYQNAEGTTAILEATKMGWTDCVKLLLESGADKNIEDNYNFDALHYAKENNSKDIIRLLE